jgi:hypothetical protein
VALLVVVYWLANSGGSANRANDGNSARLPGPRSVEVEVINAAGGERLALRATDALRARGFDVVNFWTARDRIIDKTVVIDRSGNLAAAREVAAALGLPAERVQQRLDRKLLLDVSVVLGRDAMSLAVLRSSDGKGSD